jgi:uncharacterized protein
MNVINILIGFLILFLLYQLAEANGQGLIDIPGKPYSILFLFLLVIPTAYLVARWQGDNGLASYGMGLSAGWWQNYMCGLGIGLAIQTILEFVAVQFGVRHVANIHFSWGAFLGGIVWVLFTNFPAAAGEDLVTRGYLWRFMQTSPVLVFVLCSALVYTLNHVIRLLTRPITDWYHLPFLGITLAYALYQTNSLWFVMGLHQAGNVTLAVMRQIMDVTNTTNVQKRIIFGTLFEVAMFLSIALMILLMKSIA